MIEKKISHPLLMSALVLATGFGAFSAVNLVSAHGSGSDNSSALANKLGVDEASVETAMEEIREERKEERQAEFSENLQSLVESGELTQEQKVAIEEKTAELEAEREKQREELEAWAEENGIDLKYLRMGKGHHGPKSMQ